VPRLPASRFALVSWCTRALGFVVAALLLCGAAPARQPDALLGIPTIYLTRHQDTLLDIARDYDVGYVAIRAANPGVDPWLPGAGKMIRVPTQHLLPDAPHRGIVINLAELRLYYYPAGGGRPLTFPIGIGDEGWATPVGRTEVARKIVHPSWVPTASEHAEDPDLPSVVPPGPDNPMGQYALYLGWREYAIHGTNRVYSIGRRDSHGCIRLYPEDIERLFKLVKIGTPVTVVDQLAKIGWSGGELYLEIDPGQANADSLETTGTMKDPSAVDADAQILAAAGADAPRLDWYAIHLAEARRDGIPVRITRHRDGF
jgi:L,D-transpeptidase ErfK/SrfK